MFAIILLCIGIHPCNGADASLRYFNDTILESEQLLEKTHLALNEADTVENLFKSTASPTCELCVYYERLLAHIDSLMEIPNYTLLPNQGSWVTPIWEDLQRIHCITRHLIDLLRTDRKQSPGTAFHDTCIDLAWEEADVIDNNQRARNNLRLLEASIVVFRFHIDLTREELLELDSMAYAW